MEKNMEGERVLEVGDHLKDGTVCIAVDLKKNEALFAPAEIIGGEAKFYNKIDIPRRLNEQNAHGHRDWRNITDKEGETLAKVWNKVAPPELLGSAAPWFWLQNYTGFHRDAGARRAGETSLRGVFSGIPLAVPCVRSGPALSAF
jgi:hypothetical protein